MKYLKILLNLLLLVLVITSGCNNKSEIKLINTESSINYKKRNEVYEGILFGNVKYDRISYEKNNSELILKSEQEKNNPFQLINYNLDTSKIKMLKLQEYGYKFGKLEQIERMKYDFKFNKFGRCIEKKFNYMEKERRYTTTIRIEKLVYEYSKDTILNNILATNMDNSQLFSIKYEYNEENKLTNKKKELINTYTDFINLPIGNFELSRHSQSIEKDLRNNGNFNISYRYDSTGKRIELLEWFESGSLHKKEIYSYDTLSNIHEASYYEWNYKKNKLDKTKNVLLYKDSIEIFAYNLDNVLSRKLIFNYNENYDLTKSVMINYENNIISKGTYKYDNNYNRIEKLIYLGDQNIGYKIIYIFDNKNKLVNINIFSGDSELVYQFKFEYNNFGLVSSELILNNKKEQLLRTDFHYNEKNEIKEFVEYDNLNEPIKSTTFEYEYYD